MYYTIDMNGLTKKFSALVFFFLIGAVAPAIPWLLSKKYPNSFLKYVKYVYDLFELNPSVELFNSSL